MTGPNLSAWAIRHPALIRYLVSLVVLADAQAGWRPKKWGYARWVWQIHV